MRKRILVGISALIALTALSVGMFGFSGANAQGRGIEYEVTITNLTKGQIISPSVVAIHDRRAESLFTLGEEASDELAALAEDAMIDPLVMALKDNDRVDDVQVLTADGGPLLPGQSASVTVSAANRFREITIAGMLVTTNDAFFALNGVRLSPFKKTAMYHAIAYDAGSEANTEDCADIPGPPCGNPGVTPDAEPEGYVYVSNGIHSMDDPDTGLNAMMHDWNNPVALIKIVRK